MHKRPLTHFHLCCGLGSGAAGFTADVFGMTLLLSEAGKTFTLSNVSIWVQPVAIAPSVAQQEVQL